MNRRPAHLESNGRNEHRKNGPVDSGTTFRKATTERTTSLSSRHPAPTSRPISSTISNNNSYNRKKTCRYGARCTRNDCHFSHPPQRTPATVACYEIGGPTTTTTPFVTADAPFQRKKDEADDDVIALKYPSRTNTPGCISSSYGSSVPQTTASLPTTYLPPPPPPPTTPTLPFCSWHEFQERQRLQQVSIFEATLETAGLPQNQRRMDPNLAVAKFRRSVASTSTKVPFISPTTHDGGDKCHHTVNDHYVHSKSTLTKLLPHLMTIGTTPVRSTPTPAAESNAHHHHADTPVMMDAWQQQQQQQSWAEFLVDRLRACQADAIRLLDRRTTTSDGDKEGPMPPDWHVQMIRLLIWLRYWMPWTDAFLEKTTSTMLSTALEQYWSSSRNNNNRHAWDDEILSYSTLLRLAKGNGDATLPTSLVLLDYVKYIPAAHDNNIQSSYPRFHAALQLTAGVSRGEYYPILHPKSTHRGMITILGRCCLASRLAHWRYQQCQQYNVSFGKQEDVSDLDRLLGFQEEWSVQHVEDYLGLPSRREEDKDEGNVVVTFKQNIMTDDPPFQESYQDHTWVFGSSLNHEAPMKISSIEIQSLLQSRS